MEECEYMKRDLDLLRNILLKIENLDSANTEITKESFSDLNSDIDLIYYHLQLLNDAGFIESSDISWKLSSNMFVKRLTFSGCEYLDLVRNQGVWENTKSKLIKIGGSASISIIKEVAESVIREGLKTFT